MNALTILTLSLALHALAFALLIRHMRREKRARLGTRRAASAHWHQRFNVADKLHTRGGTILDTLAALLMCAAIAAAITAGLSDDEDFVWPLTPTITTHAPSQP